MALPESNLITGPCMRISFITVYLCLMIFGETKHISKEWNQKSMTLAGKYMRLSQHKSIKQEDSSLIISTDVFLFFFCLSCHWLCFQGLSVTRSNRLQGLHSQAWVAATADASLKWPCFYSRSKPVCLFFWCFNVAWHVKMCNLGPVVLSLELKCILLEGKKKKKKEP